ncbi:MAG: type II toxin-antitoxin system HipA family toxin, partial [Halieaceae bacterium]|nr:type II toxin-antitoxin system HipA family toxin [Halieaceae bacterium]
HQMTMNGKREHFTLDDFRACAKTAALKRGSAEKIIAAVQDTVANWRDYAEVAGVPAANAERIQQTLNIKPYC